jgi:hypothetical protein
VIRHNRIHDIFGLTGMGWGIYPDEQSRQVLVTGNLVYRTFGCFHAHMAHDLRVENNLFAGGTSYLISVASNSRQVSFARNVLVTREEPVFSTAMQDPLAQVGSMDRNLYHSLATGRPTLGNLSWEQWHALGLDAHSIFADPLLADPAKDDFTLKANSPARELGFVPLDLAGVPEATMVDG